MLQAQEFKNHSRSRVSLNDLFIKSISNYLSPAAADQRELAIARRLDYIDRRQEKLNRMLEEYSQALARFIQTYLTTTQEVPPDQQAAAQTMGNRRWKRFMDLIVEDLGYGKSFFTSLPDKTFTDHDFTTISKVKDRPAADTELEQET